MHYRTSGTGHKSGRCKLRLAVSRKTAGEGGIKMTKELKKLLETVVMGNNDLMSETIEASKKILAGGYEGHQEDVEALEGIETGFELERLLSQGKWYFMETETWKRKLEK